MQQSVRRITNKILGVKGLNSITCCCFVNIPQLFTEGEVSIVVEYSLSIRQIIVLVWLLVGAFEICCKCLFWHWTHYVSIVLITHVKIKSQFPLGFDKFIKFNQQNLHAFLLKSVTQTLLASFVLFGIEFALSCSLLLL